MSTLVTLQHDQGFVAPQMVRSRRVSDGQYVAVDILGNETPFTHNYNDPWGLFAMRLIDALGRTQLAAPAGAKPVYSTGRHRPTPRKGFDIAFANAVPDGLGLSLEQFFAVKDALWDAGFRRVAEPVS